MGDEADRLNEWGDCEHGEEVAIRMERDSERKAKEEYRRFKNAVKAEVDRQLKLHGIEKKLYKPQGKMIDRVCACGCGTQFQARVADVKRGWGKFASKSCAAIYKDKRTHGRNRDYYGS